MGVSVRLACLVGRSLCESVRQGRIASCVAVACCCAQGPGESMDSSSQDQDRAGSSRPSDDQDLGNVRPNPDAINLILERAFNVSLTHRSAVVQRSA